MTLFVNFSFTPLACLLCCLLSWTRQLSPEHTELPRLLPALHTSCFFQGMCWNISCCPQPPQTGSFSLWLQSCRMGVDSYSSGSS
uniref:Putative secreted protein n=1 Tax=Ixodes ricinus TaxID=34613 RepID=A0A6B0U875_IXORI